ncbi:MAG TPA: LysM peptidoglycan-binding domain-containing protein [Anaerolineaceae bacterium]
MRQTPHNIRYRAALLTTLLALLAGCTTAPAAINPAPLATQAAGQESSGPSLFADPTSTRAPLTVPTYSVPFRLPQKAANFQPTPDPARDLPPIRQQAETYVVQPGDSLAAIAKAKGVSLDAIMEASQINNPDLLSVGQVLTVPAPLPRPTGPDTKLIPDSELVNGPVNAFFDLNAYIQGAGGYLSRYRMELDDESYTGAQVVERVAQEYSVNPRLLLALIEDRSGWLTDPAEPQGERIYAAGWGDPRRESLYLQLTWAAQHLNYGYYAWKVNAVSHYLLPDGSVVPPAATLNPGTVAIQNLMSQYYDYESWLRAMSPQGFIATYHRLFGDPFNLALEPLLPKGLQQPPLQLPFEPGADWSFTGGPHAGWAAGSAWAALDFAPPGDALGCVQNDAWVTAMADGLIVRSANGAVIQDLDGDGYEQTGWVIFYMHIETRDRVEVGKFVRAGERIGHASCEGGVSSGTHTHLARRYNGEWISADGDIPFNMEGWVSSGTGGEYNGVLRRNGQTVEAWAERVPENQIGR